MDKLTSYEILREKPYLMDAYPVLNAGKVELIDWNGSDERIEDAARLSYQKGTRSVKDRAQLIDYLVRHLHLGPLEMCSMTFYFEMPLFVVAQLVRHRTAKMNQESARYSVMEDKAYVPQSLRPQSTRNKQVSEGQLLDDLNAMGIEVIELSNELAFDSYNNLLSKNVGREQARTVIPVGTYTKLMWQSDLRNLFNFLRLRLDPHAQPEIQEYANVMNYLAAEIFPLAHTAFEEHILYAETFSRTQMELIRALLFGIPESFDALVAGAAHFEMRDTVRDEMLMKLFNRKGPKKEKPQEQKQLPPIPPH